MAGFFPLGRIRAPKKMPSNFRSLTNTSREENMVEEPNLDTFVVCRAKEDVGLVQIGEVRHGMIESFFFHSSYVLFIFCRLGSHRKCKASNAQVSCAQIHYAEFKRKNQDNAARLSMQLEEGPSLASKIST